MTNLILQKKLKEILEDRVSGSSLIAKKIAEIFPDIPENEFDTFIKQIIKQHSAMAAVINTINYLSLIKEGKQPEKIIDYSRQIFKNFWQENQQKKKWLTLSMSHWVISCLLSCPGKINLKLGISYPDKEGLITHEKIKNIHDTSIYEDNQLCSEVESVDSLILGADLISEDFIVNKAGSFALALAADYFKKPLYIISSGDKYLSPELLKFHEMKTTKIDSRSIQLFEKIPRQLITKIYLTTSQPNHPFSKILKNIPSL